MDQHQRGRTLAAATPLSSSAGLPPTATTGQGPPSLSLFPVKLDPIGNIVPSPRTPPEET